MVISGLVWGGLLLGGIAMAITRSVFYGFGGRSTTERTEYPWNFIPWVAEYLAFAICAGYFLYVTDNNLPIFP